MKQWLPISIITAFVAFWLWMLLSMLNNSRVEGTVRLYWIVGFLLLGLPTAIYYFFTEWRG